jgi:phenylalanyl-tRNA synthetase alpha subunit
MSITTQRRKRCKSDETNSARSNTSSQRVSIGNVKNILQRYVVSEVKDRLNVNAGNVTNSLSKGNVNQAFANVKRTLANKIATKVQDKYDINASKPLNALARGNSIKQVANSMRQPVADMLIAEIQKRAKPQAVTYGGKSQSKKKSNSKKK